MRFAWLLIILFLGACSSKSNIGSSSVSFTAPTVADLEHNIPMRTSAITSGDVSWDKACFMLNVTASDLPSTSSSSCSIPAGSFAGSVAPGSAVTVQVPKGDGRKFEVLAYFRLSSSAPCPSGKSVNDFDRSRTALLGSVNGISIQKDEEAVDINIALPTAMLVSQYNLPASCEPSTSPSRLRPVSGVAAGATAAGYKVSATAGGPSQTVSTTNGGYKVIRKVRK